MTVVDPGLRFWLGYAEQRGAVSEDAGFGSAVVILPETLQRTLGLPEEVAVTADPDAAREEGALLLVPGQPVLDRAAEAVLAEGDAGVSWLAWPASDRPSRHDLIAAARERFSVDHGRIDAGGEPAPVLFPLLRVGALITYTVSLDLRFQEREEVWVDGRTGLPLEARVRRLGFSGSTEPAPASPCRELTSDLVGAFTAAQGLFDALAADRLRQFARQADDARRRQLDAADAYYRDALASVARRRATATAERRTLLDAQEEATRVERSRRVAEIEATFAPRHEVRPIRAHLVLAPALEVPVDVRRGGRTYPVTLAWILGAATFAHLRCPDCASDAPLVAGRQRLGCRSCLPAPSPVSDSHAAVGGRAKEGRDRTAFPPPSPPAPPPTQAGSRPVEEKPPAAARGRAPAKRPSRRTQPPPSGAAPPGGFERAGTRLASDLWGAVARGERWPRKGKGVAADSPFAAAVRLFGAHGPVRSVGLESGRSIIDFSSITVPPVGTLACTTGRLWTGSEEVFPFTLRWSLDGAKPVVSEVLPFLGAGYDRLPSPTRLHPGTTPLLMEGAPTPRLPLDPVAAATWALAVAPLGIPVVLRCLAAWWRVRDDIDEARFPPPVVATALVRLVATRAGAHRASLPIGHGTDDATVTVAARHLQSRLELSRTRPW
ncbi:MAG: hypothetical protein ACR2LJ_09025 [Acidimicrobiales bacterium]